MIILDTNVLSALMRTTTEAAVVAWLDRQPAESVWITSITLFEARFGLGAAAQRPAAADYSYAPTYSTAPLLAVGIRESNSGTRGLRSASRFEDARRTMTAISKAGRFC